MYSEARKLHLIEEVLKVKSEAVLIELEAVLKKNSDTEVTSGKIINRKPSEFAGSITKETAQAILSDIQQSRNEWEKDF